MKQKLRPERRDPRSCTRLGAYKLGVAESFDLSSSERGDVGSPALVTNRVDVPHAAVYQDSLPSSFRAVDYSPYTDVRHGPGSGRGFSSSAPVSPVEPSPARRGRKNSVIFAESAPGQSPHVALPSATEPSPEPSELPAADPAAWLMGESPLAYQTSEQPREKLELSGVAAWLMGGSPIGPLGGTVEPVAADSA